MKLAAFGAAAAPSPVEIQLNDQTITITPVLPYERVFAAVQWCVNFIVADRPFISGPLRRVITELAVLHFYTDIDLSAAELPTFTADNLYEWYDLVKSHGIYDTVRLHLSNDQLEFFYSTLDETLNSLVAYRNSTVGVIEKLQQNADSLNATFAEALQTMNDENTQQTVSNLLEAASV